MAKTQQTYDASSISVLEGLEAVRRRPGMYIGSTGAAGLHHLIWEIVDNSIDEAMAGHASSIEVILGADGSVTVIDDGRGIPVAAHPQTGVSTLTTVLTVLHAGGKFGGNGYKVSGGLHGVGVSVVNALSSELEAEVIRDGVKVSQRFVRGVPETKNPKKIGKAKGSGTTIKFWADPEIFEVTTYDQALVMKRLRQRAYLTPGVTIRFRDERDGVESVDETYHYKGGVADFVEALVDDRRVTKKTFSASTSAKVGDTEIEVDVACVWTVSYDEEIRSFVNTISTVDGGTHEEGFSRALTRIINQTARDLKVLKPKDQNFTGADVREGLVAVLSIRMPEPQFEGQTKGKLGSSVARTAVEQAVAEEFSAWLKVNRSDAKRICERAAASQKARAAARAAKELTRRKSALEASTLPAKLSDCRRRSAEGTELFIVEGDSAGGTAKAGRDSEFQAILPLRGKIKNVWRVGTAKMLANAECAAIATAIGGGVGRDFDLEAVRYEKVVLMVDADADGSHIRVLLLALLWKYMRPLIEAGRVYAAQPPLYRLEMKGGGEPIYTYTEPETQAVLEKLRAEGREVKNQYRYKGLGEMDAELLWETTMDPAQRVLRRITAEDAEAAVEAFDLLMGSDAGGRRLFISQHAADVTDVDII